MNAVIYIHGKGGSATESEHYIPLFPNCEVIGLDYQPFFDLKGTECGVAITPWEAGKEIRIAVEELKNKYENVILIANSIGAFFCMNAGIDNMIQKAYFISPVVDMEKLNGYELTGEWLRYVKSHTVKWSVPTCILYGSKDDLVSLDTISDFAKTHNVPLTVMEGGEHRFHTEEQMAFLDNWIKNEMKREI